MQFRGVWSEKYKRLDQLEYSQNFSRIDEKYCRRIESQFFQIEIINISMIRLQNFQISNDFFPEKTTRGIKVDSELSALRVRSLRSNFPTRAVCHKRSTCCIGWHLAMFLNDRNQFIMKYSIFRLFDFKIFRLGITFFQEKPHGSLK